MRSLILRDDCRSGGRQLVIRPSPLFMHSTVKWEENGVRITKLGIRNLKNPHLKNIENPAIIFIEIY